MANDTQFETDYFLPKFSESTINCDPIVHQVLVRHKECQRIWLTMEQNPSSKPNSYSALILREQRNYRWRTVISFLILHVHVYGFQYFKLSWFILYNQNYFYLNWITLISKKLFVGVQVKLFHMIPRNQRLSHSSHCQAVSMSPAIKEWQLYHIQT